MDCGPGRFHIQTKAHFERTIIKHFLYDYLFMGISSPGVVNPGLGSIRPNVKMQPQLSGHFNCMHYSFIQISVESI